MESALAIDRSVNQSLLDLHKVASEHVDAQVMFVFICVRLCATVLLCVYACVPDMMWIPFLKPGLHFERISTPYTQTIVRTWGALSRPPMPIYALVIAQMQSILNTPTIRRLLRVDAGLSLDNSPQPPRIRKLLRGISKKSISLKWYANRCCV